MAVFLGITGRERGTRFLYLYTWMNVIVVRFRKIGKKDTVTRARGNENIWIKNCIAGNRARERRILKEGEEESERARRDFVFFSWMVPESHRSRYMDQRMNGYFDASERLE